MAKIIMVDDNGSTANFNITELSESQHGLSLRDFLTTKLTMCECGRIVLSATMIQKSEKCQACDRGAGTLRYNALVCTFGRSKVLEYFAMEDAAAEAEGSDVQDEFAYYFVNGITDDPGILATDIKNKLDELDEEEFVDLCKLLHKLMRKED